MEAGEDLGLLEQWVHRLSANLSPEERRGLQRRIAKTLRAANAKRERANVMPPDAAPMPPRKKQGALRAELERSKSSIRGGLMFRKAAGQKWLRARVVGEEAQVGFVGAVARIMRVHQDGLTDKVNSDPGAKAVKYPERRVIGSTPADRETVMDAAIEQLGKP